MPKRSRSNNNDDDLERKNDESREIPVWLHSSPLYQMFLENAAADGGADDAERGIIEVPRGAPLCASLDCSDARLLYRTIAYWHLDFGALPPVFFAAWFQLNVADRAQAVDTVLAFHAELHPDTCCASMLQRDAHTVYSLWWSNAGEAPRRVHPAVVLEAVERGALRCVKVLHAVNGDAKFYAADINLWFLAALTGGHLGVAAFLHETHSVLRSLNNWSERERVFKAVKASGNLDVYKWITTARVLSSIQHLNYHGIVTGNYAAASSAVEIVAWCHTEIKPQFNHVGEFLEDVMEDAMKVADFAVMEWFLANAPVCSLWHLAVTQPRVDILEWLVDKAPPDLFFRATPLADRGGYTIAAQEGNLSIMQWMHAHGVAFGATANYTFHCALEHMLFEDDATRYSQHALAMVDWLLETVAPLDRLRALSGDDGQSGNIFATAMRVPVGARVPLLQGLLDRGFQVPLAHVQDMYRIAVDYTCRYWANMDRKRVDSDKEQQLLDWIAAHIPMQPHDSAKVISATVSRAVMNGNTVALEWIDRNWSVDWRVHASTYKINRIHHAAATLRFLFAKGAPPGASVFEEAMKFGGESALAVRKLLMDNDCAWNAATMVSAIKHGHLSVIKWLRAKGCRWSSSEAMRCAVTALEKQSKLHRPTLKWLRAQEGFPKHL